MSEVERWTGPAIAHFVELSEAGLRHLGEVMRGETDGVDATGGCIYCREILKAFEGATGMHPVQRDVADFFESLNLPIGETPAIRNPQVNADLILEEARETAEAITGRRVKIEFDDDQPAEREQSLVGVIDGLCDQLATIYGAAVTFGIDLAPFWDEVHRTNLAKAGGPKREDGKQLKPPGWRPPNIVGLLSVLYPFACRECGCTPECACWHEDFGGCSWAEPGLCTACAPDAGDGWEHPSLELIDA